MKQTCLRGENLVQTRDQINLTVVYKNCVQIYTVKKEIY